MSNMQHVCMPYMSKLKYALISCTSEQQQQQQNTSQLLNFKVPAAERQHLTALCNGILSEARRAYTISSIRQR